MSARPLVGLVLALLTSVALATVAVSSRQATAVDVAAFHDLSWRSLGPFRGGRTTAAAASASEAGVFYAAAEGAGVWKTNDAGRTWRSVFEAPPFGSVGAIATAPSQRAIVYVGTGDARSASPTAAGSGLYKTSDGGGSWTAVGLSTTERIAAIAVDPHDAARLWVAVQGPASGPSAARGVYRSTNGGLAFERVLFANDSTGATGVTLDPANASVIYATLSDTRTDAARGSGPPAGSGLFKSSDAGTTWQRLSNGLPAATDIRQLSLAIAPSAPNHLVMSVTSRVGAGLYRSDSGGEAWTMTNSDAAITPPDGAPAQIAIDPSQPDTWLVVHGDVWITTNGGGTFTRWVRQPADRDDAIVQQSATAPGVLLLAGSQGTIISVNGGESWSSRFTQPTAALAHLATDSSFPYRVCGSQRYSAPVCVPSRSEPDRLGLPQWQVLPLPEDGVAVPDPHDPDLVYGGAVVRFDRRTLQLQEVGPDGVRSARTDAPLAFSADGRSLFLADRTIWKSPADMSSWASIGPDPAPASTVIPGAAAISALAVSVLDDRVLWTGSTDGVVHATRNGGTTWVLATPAAMPDGSTILSIEASHFDGNSAYVSAVPPGTPAASQLLRTRDLGATWTALTLGADSGNVAVVREDPFRRGLLFAGTDRSVFLSFDDGETWQPFRLNLPITPISDITIRDATVIVSTTGRGFWALDDISPLRQMTGDIARAAAFLFRPAPVWRVRATVAVPPGGEDPTPEAPPEGATLSYLLGPNVRGPVTLEILETGTGNVIREFYGEAGLARPSRMTAADQLPLDARPGLHHVVWDLRYAAPTTTGDVPGPRVAPATYQVRLAVAGRTLRQAVIVRMDPRARATATDLAAQLKLALTIDAKLSQVDRAVANLPATSTSDRRHALVAVFAELRQLAARVQQADARPGPALEAAAADTLVRADAALALDQLDQ